MKLAPICLFSYNRISTLKKTIESLAKNDLIDESFVYIFNDGPKSKTDEEKVNEIRKYLKNDLPFKNYKLIFQEKNKGLSKSIIEGVSEIIEKHGKIIVLEDDIVTSESFLRFMNQGLNFYNTSSDIFSISGFSFPLRNVPINSYSNFFSTRAYPWGWATWKKEWEKVIWDEKPLKDITKQLDKNQINKAGADLNIVLNFHFMGKVDSWDTVWAINQIALNKLTIMPWLSQTTNIGFNNDSTHCNGFNFHKTELNHIKSETFHFDPVITENIEVSKAIRYKYSYRNKIIERIKSIRKISDLVFLLNETKFVIKRYL